MSSLSTYRNSSSRRLVPRSSAQSAPLLSALLAVCLVGSILVITAPVASAATVGRAQRSTPLLLVHGYSDSCNVFNDVDSADGASSGSVPAAQFLADNHFTNIVKVGYYSANSWNLGYNIHQLPRHQDSDYMAFGSPNYKYNPVNALPGACDTNVSVDPGSSMDATTNCKQWNVAPPGGKLPDGYSNEPIMYLACEFAWYVVDDYTAFDKPVDILAHSMGGLIVRAAMAFSGGAEQPGFPPTALLVDRVVTVATPHAGLTGVYGALYNQVLATNEVKDMYVCEGWVANCSIDLRFLNLPVISLTTSTFMRDLRAAGTPRGGGYAYWALVASSTPCNANNPGGLTGQTLLSCINLPSFPLYNDPYYDTDGVIQASSALGIAADYKILYGAYQNGFNAPVTSGGVQYSHEANSCEDLPGAPYMISLPIVGSITVPGEFCLTAPYFFNDAGTATTNAWVCPQSCNGGITDAINGQFGAQSRALPEIAHLLIDPLTGPTYFGRVTNAQPGMTTYLRDGKLYVCTVDVNGNLHIASSTDGVNFAYTADLPEASNSGCALGNYNSDLYVAWAGTDNRLNLESSVDGVHFGNKMTLGDSSNTTPQIADVNFQLYLAWTGTNGATPNLNIKVFNGTAWQPTHVLPDMTFANSGPALVMHNSTGWLAWRGIDPQHSLNIASFSMTNFPAYNIKETLNSAGNGSEQTDAAPALATLHGRLLLGWQGNATNQNLNVMTWSEKNSSFVATKACAPDPSHDCKNTYDDTTATGPAMVEFANQLYWAFTGTGTQAQEVLVESRL